MSLPTRIYVVTVAALLIGAGILHLLKRLGSLGRRTANLLCAAPWIDLVLMYFTLLPAVVGALMRGWAGLGAAVAGEVTALWLWIILHELAHPAARKGPRIYRALDRIVGPWRNHLAVWATSPAVPGFWVVRLCQVMLYPPLVWLVDLPRCRAKDYVSISRQKFQGLVGYDLIWCLYCDWMTGVWSLGTEMLRNVESFWCPIRFTDAGKCARCVREFPDINHGWVSADGTMADVVAVVNELQSTRPHAWFGHPVRLTVRGMEPSPPKSEEAVLSR